ncbi:MAG: class aminotransferase [Solirubrobacterales bacterium]|nr:class aminotransferase [Solirubrobacterales bacterium]
MAANTHVESASHALLARAAAVIPGGMWGHQSTRFLTSDHPSFVASSRGARFTDVDGREYVDLMCAWGPMILGYQNPIVEQAVVEQAQLGDTQNGPSARAVELAELLVETIDHADWAILAKNGTDATTACVTIARAETGRDVVLLARGCYHGAAPWCTPAPAGVLDSDRASLDYFEYNDQASFDDAVQRAGDRLAAVVITPFKHIEGLPNEDVTPDFARCVRRACDDAGAVLVLDDVRCGFRMNVGSSWEPLGVRPDLSAWSKALGNGYPIAAVVGADGLREAAERVFLTGSFWTGAVPMAAAIATIQTLRSTPAFDRMVAAGERFRTGILEQLDRLEHVRGTYTGPVTMPYLSFDDDPEHDWISEFSKVCLRHGLYLHPKHNWFLSAAHDEESIDVALTATAHAFAHVDAAAA